MPSKNISCISSEFRKDLDLSGGTLSLPPTLSPELERQNRKIRLTQALRVFGYLGFDHGLAGHFSARDAIDSELFWINPLGKPFGQVRVSDLVLVDGDARIVEGQGPVNLSGVPYHDEIQRNRSDIIGIAHAHSFYGKTWSAFRRPLTPFTADAAFFHEDQSLFDPEAAWKNRPGIVKTSRQQAKDATSALALNNTLIWFNHGIWAVGQTVESSAWRFLAFEDAAHSQLVVEAAGVPVPEAPSAVTAEKRLQREIFAHFSFLSLWDRISHQNRDVQE